MICNVSLCTSSANKYYSSTEIVKLIPRFFLPGGQSSLLHLIICVILMSAHCCLAPSMQVLFWRFVPSPHCSCVVPILLDMHSLTSVQRPTVMSWANDNLQKKLVICQLIKTNPLSKLSSI